MSCHPGGTEHLVAAWLPATPSVSEAEPPLQLLPDGHTPGGTDGHGRQREVEQGHSATLPTRSKTWSIANKVKAAALSFPEISPKSGTRASAAAARPPPALWRRGGAILGPAEALQQQRQRLCAHLFSAFCGGNGCREQDKQQAAIPAGADGTQVGLRPAPRAWVTPRARRAANGS